MMEVVRANEDHVADVQQWLRARGATAYPSEILVGHGFVVPGVAACWIYETGTPLMLLEHLVSNPDVTNDERDAGVDAVVAAAMSAARSLGGRVVYAMTKLAAVVERSRKHGFEVVHDGGWLIMAGLQEKNS